MQGSMQRSMQGSMRKVQVQHGPPALRVISAETLSMKTPPSRCCQIAFKPTPLRTPAKVGAYGESENRVFAPKINEKHRCRRPTTTLTTRALCADCDDFVGKSKENCELEQTLALYAPMETVSDVPIAHTFRRGTTHDFAKQSTTKHAAADPQRPASSLAHSEHGSIHRRSA